MSKQIYSTFSIKNWTLNEEVIVFLKILKITKDFPKTRVKLPRL